MKTLTHESTGEHLVEPALTDAWLEETGQPALGNLGSILLVEDEPAVRRSTERLLTRGGYVVRSAEGAAEALALLDQAFSPDLILTDVVMPGASGLQLAANIRQRDPSSRVIFMSGYSGQELGRRGVDGNVQVLKKPFTGMELLDAVRTELDRSTDRGKS